MFSVCFRNLLGFLYVLGFLRVFKGLSFIIEGFQDLFWSLVFVTRHFNFRKMTWTFTRQFKIRGPYHDVISNTWTLMTNSISAIIFRGGS